MIIFIDSKKILNYIYEKIKKIVVVFYVLWFGVRRSWFTLYNAVKFESTKNTSIISILLHKGSSKMVFMKYTLSIDLLYISGYCIPITF